VTRIKLHDLQVLRNLFSIVIYYTQPTHFTMKKLSFLLCLVLLVFYSTQIFAQDTLKVSAGSWSTELNVNPLQGEFTLNNSVNQMKVRYFKTNSLAYRLAFSFNSINRDDSQLNVYGSNPVDNSDVKKTTSAGLNLGFEKHFTGTRRLSPYVGAEIAFGIKSAKETIETLESTTEIKGAWQSIQTVQYYNNGYTYYTVVDNVERGYQSVGINLVTGFDFYVAKHFFFGYEMLFGFNYLKYDDIKTTFTPKQDQPNNTASPAKSAKETNFGPKIVNGIRLGYTF